MANKSGRNPVKEIDFDKFNENLEKLEKKHNINLKGSGSDIDIDKTAEYLKEQNSSILLVGVEPEDSPVLSGDEPGPHKIQGIGAGFVPEILEKDLLDEVVKVSNDDAFQTARNLARLEGILTGISAGANVYASLQLLARDEFKGKRIVTIGCDTGERYLSTPLFDNGS